MEVKKQVLDFFKAKGSIPGQTEEDQLAYKYLDEQFLDSMDIVEMIVEFEKMFQIHFEWHHLQSTEIGTIGGLIALITQLIEENNRV